MSKKSFIKSVSPSRARAKTIEWPLPFDDDGNGPPRVRMAILGADKMEAAHLEATDHFANIERKIGKSDPAFEFRERAALVFNAFQTEDGLPIAASVDELVDELGYESINALYGEWSHFQAEATRRPMTSDQLKRFVEELKKNTQEVPLHVLPSSWLIELIRTLASQPAPSTPPKDAG